MTEWDSEDWPQAAETQAEPDGELALPEASDTLEPARPGLSDPSSLPDDGGPESLVANSHIADLWWQEQSEDGLCMPVSVAMVASQLTGRWVSEAEVVELACGTQPPLLDGEPGAWGGMTVGQGEQLLELLGIEAETLSNGTIEDLERYVNQQGRGVILAIDSDEVWYGVDDDSQASDAMADHALRLAEIDSERGIAILEDPGNPDGQGYEISLADLKDAWADSGHEYIVTGDLAAPEVQTPDPSAISAPPLDLSPSPVIEGPSRDDVSAPLPPAALVAMAAGVMATGAVLVPLVIQHAGTRLRARRALG